TPCAASASAADRRPSGDLRVVERLVVHALVQLRSAARARDQALRPEEHDDDDDDPEDPELVLRHVEVRAEAVVDLRADVRKALTVEVGEEACAEDDPPDIPHAAEDHHREDEDRNLEEEVVRERTA